MDFITGITDLLGRVFAPLTSVVGDALEFFYSLGAPWWLSIVVLTVIVRSLLFPLTVRQVKSMRAMQDLRPQMEKIRAKYKDNKQKQQEEIMKLYKEYGVNPFSGCWPVLLQFPILIAMYSVLRWPQHPIHVPTDSDLYAAVSQQIRRAPPRSNRHC
jgi:YidC/Oxa1 family membrane protein insertase